MLMDVSPLCCLCWFKVAEQLCFNPVPEEKGGPDIVTMALWCIIECRPLYAHPLLHWWCALKRMGGWNSRLRALCGFLYISIDRLFLCSLSRPHTGERVSFHSQLKCVLFFSLKCLIQPLWGLISNFVRMFILLQGFHIKKEQVGHCTFLMARVGVLSPGSCASYSGVDFQPGFAAKVPLNWTPDSKDADCHMGIFSLSEDSSDADNNFPVERNDGKVNFLPLWTPWVM